MDVPAAIKQHDKQGCHNPRYPDTALPDQLKLSEYAPYVKERYHILHAHACFTLCPKIFEFTQISRNLHLMHVVFIWY